MEDRKKRLGNAIRIAPFTDDEKSLIDDVTEKQKKDFSYSGMPRLYHDAILIGCKYILLDDSKSKNA